MMLLAVSVLIPSVVDVTTKGFVYVSKGKHFLASRSLVYTAQIRDLTEFYVLAIRIKSYVFLQRLVASLVLKDFA